MCSIDLAALNPRPRATVAKVRDMNPLAQRLLKFLVKDLTTTKSRHLDGATGLALLECATFLDPRFKEHAVFSREERAEIRTKVKSLALKRCAGHPLLEQALQNQQELQPGLILGAVAAGARQRPARSRGRGRGRGRPVQEPAAPKRSLKRKSSAEKFLFGQDSQPRLWEQAQDLATQVDNELSLWEKIPSLETLYFICGPVSFWKKHATFFPCLAILAREILAIPASSAALERLFSGANRGVTHRRPRLKPSRASALIYGHANISLGILPSDRDQQE